MALAVAFESYPTPSAYGSSSNPWQSSAKDTVYHPGGIDPYPTGIWVPESLQCDFLPPGVTRVLAVTDRCPYSMRLRADWAVRDFVLVKEIGTGNASTVWYAFCKKTSMPLAIKTYKKRKLSPLNRCQVAREINIHSQLDHPNVIALYAAFEDNDKVYLLQEFAEGGDLFDEMKRTMGRMPEAQLVTTVLLPMMSALLAMHSLGFIHRDIKPENTLFAAGRVLKLADFGLAVNHVMERPVTRLGTLDYMAPEVLVCPDKHLPSDNKERSDLWYTPAVDAWALGVLAYELAVGRPPFGMSTRDETIRAIRQLPASFPEFMSPGLVDYISKALVKPAEHRSSLAELMQHPWVLEHARRAGMDAQVLAYLQVHQPERQLLMAAAVTAGNSGPLQQQQVAAAVPQATATQQQAAAQQRAAEAAGGVPAGAAESSLVTSQPLDAGAAAAAGMQALTPSAIIATAVGALATASGFGIISPGARGSLPPTGGGSIAAPPVATSDAAAAAAGSYLAGVMSPEQQQQQQLVMGGVDLAAAGTAAAAAMAAAGLSGGPPRVKKTAKRTGMPRCYSSKNIAGLSNMANLAGGQQHAANGHIHWHANGEMLALHVPGLLLDRGGSDSPRSSSPSTNSPTAAQAAGLVGRQTALLLSKQHSMQAQMLQQQPSQEYNPLVGGFGAGSGLGGLLAGLPGLQQQQQSLLPGSPTRRQLAASRLNGGSSGSNGSKQGGSSKRCTPEPDSDLAATLLALGQYNSSSPSSSSGTDYGTGTGQQLTHQLMQQYLRQQQMQLQGSTAGTGVPPPGSTTAAVHCQLHGHNQFMSPNASPRPMSRLGASAVAASGSSAAGIMGQQQQQGYAGSTLPCSCSSSGSGAVDANVVIASAGSSGRSSGTKCSPCSPVLKQVMTHQFESPLKRVNSQGTLTAPVTNSGTAQLLLQQQPQQQDVDLQQQQQDVDLQQQQQQQQQQIPGVMMVADVDRMQHAAAAAAARRSSGNAPGAAAAGLQVQLPGATGTANAAAAASGGAGRQGASHSHEGVSSAEASPAGLHMQELADVLSSPGSVANLLNLEHMHQQQQQQQYLAQQQQQDAMQQQQQQVQQICSRRINAMCRPVLRACSAPSLLHPALQLQLQQLQAQQQQQQLNWGPELQGSSPTTLSPHASFVPAGSAALPSMLEQQQQQAQEQALQMCMQQQPGALQGSPFSLSATGHESCLPQSPMAALDAGSSLPRALSNSMLLSPEQLLQRGSQQMAAAAANANAGLSSPPLYRAGSPGLALLQQQGSTGLQQQQMLASGSGNWDAAAMAALASNAAAVAASPNALQNAVGSAAAAAAAAAAYAGVMAAAGDASPMQLSVSTREASGGMTRSHSLLSELGPLMPVPESSAATYEQLPPIMGMTPSWQQQQQQVAQQAVQLQQEVVEALLLQQQQQQQVIQQVQQQQQQQAMQQMQLQCTVSPAGPGSICSDVYQLAAMACSPTAGNGIAAAPAGPASPLNPRMLGRMPSRLAHASSYTTS